MVLGNCIPKVSIVHNNMQLNNICELKRENKEKLNLGYFDGP